MATDAPLTVDDVRLLLIGGAAPAKMAAIIEQRGIGFTLTSDLEKKFRDDGAGDEVIKALRKAATHPASSAKAGPKTQEPEQAAPSGGYSAEREAAETSSSSGGGDEPVLHRHVSGAQAPGSRPDSSSGSSSASRGEPVLKVHPGANSQTATAAPSAPPPKPAGVSLPDPNPAEVQTIIHQFTEKEKLFKEARNNYTYHQINKVETLDPDGNIDGQYQQEWDILFDDSGKRIERVTFAPLDTLKRIIMTQEDVDAFRNIQPFVLTSDELPEYEVKYLGHVKVDEITAYVFSVRPKEIAKGRQYFQGVVWVDDRDLQIVKSEGKNVPELKTKKGENLFPRFTTYREQIDGKYWFPTFTMADDTLYFSAGSVHVKEIVRYTDYKQFKSKTRIIAVTPTDEPNPQTPPKKQ